MIGARIRFNWLTFKRIASRHQLHLAILASRKFWRDHCISPKLAKLCSHFGIALKFSNFDRNFVGNPTLDDRNRQIPATFKIGSGEQGNRGVISSCYGHKIKRPIKFVVLIIYRRSIGNMKI